MLKCLVIFFTVLPSLARAAGHIKAHSVKATSAVVFKLRSEPRSPAKQLYVYYKVLLSVSARSLCQVMNLFGTFVLQNLSGVTACELSKL